MCICRCICMYVCTRVCFHACTYVRTCVGYIYIYTHMYVYTYIYIYIHRSILVCIDSCIYVSISVCMYVYYAYIYAYIYTYVCMRLRKRQCFIFYRRCFYYTKGGRRRFLQNLIFDQIMTCTSSAWTWTSTPCSAISGLPGWRPVRMSNSRPCQGQTMFRRSSSYSRPCDFF